MLHRFTSFIKEQSLFSPADRVFLAVSGGLDSMVMAEMFHRSGFRFGIAHCNFQLRGDESDQDEQFVQSVASRYEVPFYSSRFCTADYANMRKISIQMAARELRYAWFEEIRQQEGFDLVATAHHLDDQVETLLINLLRGTGIAGLHGIPVKNGKVIRPLLFTWRDEILEFAEEKHIGFREDSSNISGNYTRNRIRHQLIPLLKSIDPDYARQLTATINRIRETESILDPLVEKRRKKLLKQVNGKWVIAIPELRKLKPLQAWMYELLSPMEFNEATIHTIIRALGQDSGKTFYSPSYRIVKNRDQLIITTYSRGAINDIPEMYQIDEKTREIDDPVHLTFTSIPMEKEYQISADKNRATLDHTKLTFPLILRKWKPGDHFYPLGMKKRKKLSDFFIDEKISIPDKEECWLLCSGHLIVWVVGHRIDHRFRVSGRTRNLLVVDLIP